MNKNQSINLEQFNKDVKELDNFFKNWACELKEKYKSFNVQESETPKKSQSRLYYNMEVVGKVPYLNGEEIELEDSLSSFYKKLKDEDIDG